jgi:hypothetical protein
MDFDGSVPLPVGTEHSQNTVSANPILQIQGEDIEVHSETDSGWPTIITMSLEYYDIGIAVDYLGTWHGGEVGMEEVDLILYYHDGEWMWRAIVAFSTKSDEIERGQYEIDGYEGYELVP